MGTRWVIAGYGLEYGHFFCVLVTAGNFSEKNHFFCFFLLLITLGNEVFFIQVGKAWGSSWQGKILGFPESLRKLLPEVLKATGEGFIFRQEVTECRLDFFLKTYSPAETAFRV